MREQLCTSPNHMFHFPSRLLALIELSPIRIDITHAAHYVQFNKCRISLAQLSMRKKDLESELLLDFWRP